MDLLRNALQHSGLSAREVARRSGISEGRLSDYVHGRHVPGSAQLLRILSATGFRVGLTPDLDHNGVLLAELLDLADAVMVDTDRPVDTTELPRFRDLVSSGG